MNKNKSIEFSIIIPFYKRRAFIKEAIVSVLNQKKVDLDQVEIIIPDDDDIDFELRQKNFKFLKKIYKNIIYAPNKYKEGPGGNRQTGLSLAIGKYVVFLDSDDQLAPQFLYNMREGFSNQKAVANVCFSRPYFEANVSLYNKFILLPLMIVRDISLILGYVFNNKTIYQDSFYLCQISHMMFRRDLIKTQKFNYDYRRGGEDWDFFIQTLQKGSIRIIPQKLLIFRYSNGSSTYNTINRQKKWESYRLLARRLPYKFRKGIFHYLFLRYIHLYEGIK